MTDGWQDRIVGARMTVDQEFAGRVRGSSLSRPQWGLVMTAVEFDIDTPDDPENARIVADTSNLEHVLPEMQSVDDQMNAMGGGTPGDGGSGGRSGGSIVGGIKDALGLGGGDDDTEQLAEESAQLAQAYADELQSHLEDENRFEAVCTAAASE